MKARPKDTKWIRLALQTPDDVVGELVTAIAEEWHYYPMNARWMHDPSLRGELHEPIRKALHRIRDEF